MDTNIIWAAGLLDADGTITIKRATRYGRYYYIPFIQVCQVDTYKGKANLAVLQKTFGGHISKATKVNQKANNSKIITWQITSKVAGNAIRQISKFSVGKKRQVMLLHEYIERFHGDDYVFHRLSLAEQNEREKYFNTMRSFQEKGFSPTTTKRSEL